MSNPFQLIRKYQRAMLVVFGVVLMAIFGLQPVFDAIQRGAGGGPGQQEVNQVKFNEGSISNKEIDSFRMQHNRTQLFIFDLQNSANSDGQRTVPQLLPIADESDDKSLADRMTVETMLLARQAKKEGVVIGDSTVDAYLNAASGGKPVNYRDVLSKRFGQSYSLSAAKRHLRDELAALQFDLMLRTGLGHQQEVRSFTAGSPVETWMAFNRLNRKAQCDAMSISVEDMVKEVNDEPSTAEMQKLYEEGKSRVADPSHQKPGFRTPHRAKLAYLVIDQQLITDREMQKITDEQVQEVYQGLVDEKDKLVIDRSAADESDGEADDSEQDTDDPETDADDSEESETCGPVQEDEDEEAEAEADKETDKETDKEADKNTGDASEDATGDDSEATGESDGADKTEPTETAEPTDAKPDDSESTSPADENAKSKGLSDADKSVADAKEAPEEADTGDDEAGDEKADDAETTEKPDSKPPAGVGEKPVKIKPLDKLLASQIRQSMLPFDIIEEAMQKATDNCRDAIEEYGGALEDYEYSKREGEQVEPPEKPDFKAVAKKNFATFGEVEEFLGRDEFAKHPVGGRMIPSRDPSRTLVVADFAFDGFGKRRINQPREVAPFGNTYLIWYTKKAESHIPEFEECERQIVDFWKYQKALELAREKAESIAEKLRADKQTLMAAYPEKSKSLGQFSWLDSEGQFQMPTVSSIPYVLDNPGDEFMETVFSMQSGDVGVATDADRENVWVIQVMKMDSGEENEKMLRELYFRTPSFASPAAFVNQQQSREIADDYKRKLFEDMGVKWVQ